MRLVTTLGVAALTSAMAACSSMGDVEAKGPDATYFSSVSPDRARDCLYREEADALGSMPSVAPYRSGWRIGWERLPNMFVDVTPGEHGGSKIEDYGLFGPDQEKLVKGDFKDCRA